MKKYVLLIVALFAVNAQLKAQKDAPKLVVGIVVDQMSYDYLYRFYPQFGKDGFKRLMDQGTNFRNVNYNYVPTYTGPGHASIYTGTTPANHGIVANDWYYRAFERDVNCAEDTTVFTVGADSDKGQCSPQFLRANTITDQLKLTYPNAKVVGVSIKDRSAIFPAGHFPNGAYWYDYRSGRFITSTYYTNELPSWVSQFKTSHPIESYLGKTWELLKDPAVYTSQTDNSPYEVLIGGKTTPTFPYGFSDKPIDQQLELFTATPFANTYLTDFALAALDGEQMGKDATTDFLAISYSTPDIVGHAFGPYSMEVEDIYYRLDQDLSNLLKQLDMKVGKGKYVVFLTADHAVVPVPQFLTDHGLPGGYLIKDVRMDSLIADCIAEFQIDPILEVTNNNIYLKEEFRDHESTAAIIAFIEKKVELWPEVKAVYSKEELTNVPSDVWQQMVALGYDKERSGELIFLLQPGYLSKSTEDGVHKGTSHGSSFNYDTHVPVLMYGMGIKAQDVFTPYNIVDVAATLVHILDVQRPNAMIGEPMLEALSGGRK